MFIVDNGSLKMFNDEKDLVKFLGSEKTKRKNLKGISIKVAEIEVSEETNGSDYLDSYIESSNRQIKLNVVLGDDLSQKVNKFKTMFTELAKEEVIKNRFLTQLETTPVDKKSLSKLFSSYVGYLLSVNESVEWYKTVLSIHNFRKIEDFYIREIFYSNGTSQYANVKVTDGAKQNFNLAKAN